MPSKQRAARHASISLVFVLLFLLLNRPDVILISQLGFTAWYPDTGLVMALLLGISPWYAPLTLFGGVLAGSIFYHSPLLSYVQTIGAVGITASYTAAAYILRGPLRIDPGLRRRRDVLSYLLVTMTAAALATVFGVLSLRADNVIRWNQVWFSAAEWFVGDSVALLSVAPFLLIHILPQVQRWLAPEDRATEPSLAKARRSWLASLGIAVEAAVQGLILILAIRVILEPRWVHYGLFYLGFIPIIWIAMRQGIRRAVSGILALNFGIVLALRLEPVAPDVIGCIGVFMLVVSGVGLITGSAISERHKVGIELHRQTSYLNSLMENTPLGIAVLNDAGHVEFTNPAFEELFLFSQSDLSSHTLSALLVPPSETNAAREMSDHVFKGETIRRTVRRKRKDGRILDVDLHAVPLIEEGKVRGVYTIYQDISEQIRASQAERDHAKALNRLVKELELRTQQMTRLSEMGDLLECCETVAEAGAVIVRSIQQVIPEAVCGIYAPSGHREICWARWHRGVVSRAHT